MSHGTGAGAGAERGHGTEIVIGYGSLLSKKGLTREGTAPRIHRAWIARVPGQRGFSHPLRGGLKLVMDAFLDESHVDHMRPLAGYPNGVGRPQGGAPPGDTEPAFDALAIEIDRDAWDWFDEREEFPPGLGAAVKADAAHAGGSIGAWLGSIMAHAGFEGYPGALYEQVRTRLHDPDRTAFDHAYIPWPLHLPGASGEALDGTSLEHEWGIICAVPVKRLPALSASQAAHRPPCDDTELLPYYHDALLGRVHGLDLADLHDPDYERRHPELADWRSHDEPHEADPLQAFVGNIPKGALPGTDTASDTGGMRPLDALTPYHDALARLADAPIAATAPETVALGAADGRVLAEVVTAAFDNPDAPKCAMDGYAVRAEDTYGAGIVCPRVLHLGGTTHAGDARSMPRVERGTCVQVATGGVVPEGADAVVMVEATTRAGDTVRVHRPHHRGQNVIPVASDWTRGDVLVPRGTRLDSARIAAVAGTGRSEVTVHARPRVAVLATGDEVVPPGTERSRGVVYDSNAWALAAFARRLGAEVSRFDPIPDDPSALTDAIGRAAADHDLVLVTGGTSAGARDLLPQLVGDHGSILFHGVAIRPGKPVLAGRWGDAWLFGLPGYPTSCLITAELFVAPVLARLAGAHDARRTMHATLAAPLRSKKGLRHFVPVSVDAAGRARSVFRGSGAVTSLSAADGLVELDEDTTLVEAGASVTVRLLR